MSKVRVDAIGVPDSQTVTPATSTLALARAGLWALFAGHLMASWGTHWDIRWHLLIGRDSFWIPPHVITYGGVTIMVLVSFGVLAWMTMRGRADHQQRTIRFLGFTGTAGYHLAAWGIALTVLAAPIDDLWHRWFGLDVTLWSPPHLLGLLGGIVNAAACWVIARETYPAGSRARLTAIVLAGALVYGGMSLGMQPGVRTAYTYGGIRFFTYPFLGALLAPLPLVITARLSKLRAAPALAVLVVVALGIGGAVVARVGFAWTKPVSFLAEEIAKDPTSPIAVAHEIARKNGTTPGAFSPLVMVLALLAALAMVAVDGRQRPVLASLAFGLTLFVGVSLLLARSPAFAHSLPSMSDTGTGVVFTALAALAGGAIAARERWLSREG